MDKKVIIITILLVCIIGIAIVSTTTPLFSLSQDKDTIKIGAIFMLTGAGSFQGDQSLKGAQMAVDELNINGGINGKTIELVAEDDGTDNPTKAIEALTSLQHRGINIVMGPNWSTSARSLAPVACANKMILISPSAGVNELEKECEYTFNLWPNDKINSKNLPKFMIDKGYNKIAIIGSKQIWETEQANAGKEGIAEFGGTLTEFIITNQDQLDFSTEIAKIKDSKPDAVIITAYTQMSIVAKQAKELGLNVPFFVVLIDQDKIDNAKGALEGTIVISPFTPSKKFQENFYKKWGVEANQSSDNSYDAVMLIAQAIKETGSEDPEVIQKYLNNLTTYQGESGSLIFNEFGGVTKEPKFQIVKDNKLVDYNTN
ncbi:MAG: ABC transporter substrate-binding protein [Candidatus ainarchaeum sp.]|nr:ABC transporter substrate-binding protein [Candidatus ainarchaeum sp.]